MCCAFVRSFVRFVLLFRSSERAWMMRSHCEQNLLVELLDGVSISITNITLFTKRFRFVLLAAAFVVVVVVAAAAAVTVVFLSCFASIFVCLFVCSWYFRCDVGTDGDVVSH